MEHFTIIRITMIVIMIVFLVGGIVTSKDRSGVIIMFCITFVISVNLFLVISSINGYNGKSWSQVVYETKTECESTLPRNQECKIIITATPIEK